LVGARTSIWLIGDAPQDILAARANRIQCVAVHTGISTARDLGRLRPDLLLRSLNALKPVDLI
jgi:phosphoglycolate phosphatase-like HAD superfamily hydrolase